MKRDAEATTVLFADANRCEDKLLKVTSVFNSLQTWRAKGWNHIKRTSEVDQLPRPFKLSVPASSPICPADYFLIDELVCAKWPPESPAGFKSLVSVYLTLRGHGSNIRVICISITLFWYLKGKKIIHTRGNEGD